VVGFQATVLLATPIGGELRHADRPHGFGHRLALRLLHLILPELGDDLLRLVLFLGHSCILQMAQKPYLREDHFSGGRPSIMLLLPFSSANGGALPNSA
jgi:hypothetical protein